jgi:hypothetical protein
MSTENQGPCFFHCFYCPYLQFFLCLAKGNRVCWCFSSQYVLFLVVIRLFCRGQHSIGREMIAGAIPGHIAPTWLNWIIMRYSFTWTGGYLFQMNAFITHVLNMKCLNRVMRGGYIAFISGSLCSHVKVPDKVSCFAFAFQWSGTSDALSNLHRLWNCFYVHHIIKSSVSLE